MKKSSIARVLGRIVACILILMLGVGIMRTLVSQREAPVQAEIRERSLQVSVQEAVYEDVTIYIQGTGHVRARDVVTISPEVPGRIVAIHRNLEVGEIIPEGETLFEIDPRDYQARSDEAAASVAQLGTSVDRLKKQYEIDEERLKTLKGSGRLAREEYDRIQSLFTNDRVGSQSSVDQAERTSNTARDQADQLEQTVSLYPMRIREAQSNLASMEAMADLASYNVERTRVVAPFDARIKTVDLEAGQYVSPGINVLTLADDSLLEISVGLSSDEARSRLQFKNGHSKNGATHAWFKDLEPVKVDVAWTELSGKSHWTGVLDRVETFEPLTRTLTVVVRLEGDDALSNDANHFPLVEDMFCTIRIPGKMAQRVVRLPAESVSFPQSQTAQRTVYLAQASPEVEGEYRLKTINVTESHFEGDHVFVSEGLKEGDKIVTTRLVNPLENSLLSFQKSDDEGATE